MSYAQMVSVLLQYFELTWQSLLRTGRFPEKVAIFAAKDIQTNEPWIFHMKSFFLQYTSLGRILLKKTKNVDRDILWVNSDSKKCSDIVVGKTSRNQPNPEFSRHLVHFCCMLLSSTFF